MAASFADLRKKFAKLSTAVADGLLEWQILQGEACTLCSACTNMMNRTPAMSKLIYFKGFNKPEDFQHRALAKHLDMIEKSLTKLQLNKLKLVSLSRQLSKHSEQAQRLLNASTGIPQNDQTAMLQSLAKGMEEIRMMLSNDAAARTAILDEMVYDSPPDKLAALHQLIVDHPCVDVIMWQRFGERNTLLVLACKD